MMMIRQLWHKSNAEQGAYVILAEPYPEQRELLESIHRVELPAGRYARYRHTDDYSGLQQAYTRFFSQWLPTSGYKCADDACPFDVYVNSPYDTPEEQLITDIYIKLEDE